MTILNILTVIPLAPLFAACFVGLFGKKLPKYYSFGVPILGVSIAFALSMYSLYLTLYGFKLNETVYTWLASGGYIFEVGFFNRYAFSRHDGHCYFYLAYGPYLYNQLHER